MWPAHTSVEISKKVVNEWVACYADSKFYQWAIVVKAFRDEPIGTIGVVHMDEAIDMVHIGYCVGKNWWHQGITSEAFSGIIPFLIEQVGAKRIESRHDPRNPHSGKVMLNCGLQYEGTLRNSDHNNQGICDAAMYGLLSTDYYIAKDKTKLSSSI